VAMANNKVSSSKLEEALEILFEQLQQQNFLPSNISENEKKQIIENVMDMLKEQPELTLTDLKNPAIEKALCLSLAAETVAVKKPELNMQFDHSILFKDNSNTPQNEIKNDLQKELFLLFIAMNQLNPKKQFSKEAIQDLSENIADQLSDKFMQENEQKRLAENNNALDTFAEMFTIALRSLFGGIDPRVAGGEKMPVAEVMGNIAGITKEGVSPPTSGQFVDEQVRYDAGKPDPHGMENSAATRMNSIVDVFSAVLEEANIFSSAPQNTPPASG